VHVGELAGQHLEGEAGEQVELIEKELIGVPGFVPGGGERLDGEVSD
jgi:hypothetical protein